MGLPWAIPLGAGDGEGDLGKAVIGLAIPGWPVGIALFRSLGGWPVFLVPQTEEARRRFRRFLIHTLPDGFHRIRHFGFMANRHRPAKLALCRSVLDHEQTAPNNGEPSPVDSEAQTWAEVPACPDCGGVMRIIERFRHSFSRSSPRTSP